MKSEDIFKKFVPVLSLTEYPNKKSDLEYIRSGKKFIEKVKREAKDLENKIQDYMLDRIKSSQESFFAFFQHIEHCWENYLSLLAISSLLARNLTFLYPEKIRLIRELVQITVELNVHIYFLTDIEKEVYGHFFEMLPDERKNKLLQAIQSFPTFMRRYLASIKRKGIDFYPLPNVYSSFLVGASMSEENRFPYFSPLQKSFQRLFSLFIGDSLQENDTTKENYFDPKNQLEKTVFRLMMYDHFFELMLRESGILFNDLKFFVDLCDRLGCAKEYGTLIESLDRQIQATEQKFLPEFKPYLQTKESCGAVCLANATQIYFPEIKPSKELEEAILEKVTVEGFPNNIPSSIVFVARKHLGVPAFFFADMETFRPLFVERPPENKAVKKFQEDLKKIKPFIQDYRNLSQEFFIGALQKGRFIAYVSGKYPNLHYKMVIGYNLKGESPSFYVLDPLEGIKKIKWEVLQKDLWNEASMWGVEFHPPEENLFPYIHRILKNARELAKWKL